jgi:hypothetical protein
LFLSSYSNGVTKETAAKASPDVEVEVKKPPSASRGSKRVSTMRPDTGEGNRKFSQKKKPGSRAGATASPQAATSTLPSMPEAEDKELSELTK